MKGLVVPAAALEHLQKFAEWDLATTEARKDKRLSSSPQELKAFYKEARAAVDDVLSYLGRVSLDHIPTDAMQAFRIALALAEVGIYVEWFDGQPVSPIAREVGSRVKMVYEPSPLAATENAGSLLHQDKCTT